MNDPASHEFKAGEDRSVKTGGDQSLLKTGGERFSQAGEDQSSTFVTTPDPLINALLENKYKVLKFIGQGGMSRVYLAKDVILNKNVAVKVLLPHLVANQASYQRFHLEARAASSLTHPNVITIYSFGETDDGQPFLVMDYLEGIPLSELIRSQGPLPLDRAIKIFVQVADALASAHTNGVLHRDLKPSNIMLLDPGQRDMVKIVDFGIAKLLPQDGGESMHLTQTGEVFGSPFYMSPEQCKGEKCDARSDIYSLGCLMYETIAGEPPLVGQNMMETLYKHVNDTPGGLRARTGINVPEKFEALVFKTMAKSPELRYQTMEQVKKELEQLGDSKGVGFFEGVTLKLELLALKVRPFKGRERTLLIVGAVVSMFLCFFAVKLAQVYLVSPQMAEPAPEVAWAVPAWPKAEDETTYFVERHETGKKHLTQLGMVAPLSMEYVEQLKMWAEDAEKHGRYLDAADAYKRTLKVCDKVDGTRSLPALAAAYALAIAYDKAHELEQAKSSYQELLFRMEGLKNARPDRIASVKTKLANLLFREGRYEAAAEYYKGALDTMRSTRKNLKENEPIEFATTCNRLADAYRLKGEYALAERYYEEALLQWKKALSKDDPRYYMTVYYLGVAHFKQKHYKRARTYIEDALCQMEKVLGEENPRYIEAYKFYCAVMWEKGSYLSAIKAKIRLQELEAKRTPVGTMPRVMARL